jgi:hypothetical protein
MYRALRDAAPALAKIRGDDSQLLPGGREIASEMYGNNGRQDGGQADGSR